MFGGIIRWEAPPPIRHSPPGPRTVNWQLVADQARERARTEPDPELHWGLVRENIKPGEGSAWQARITGARTSFFAPAGAFEAQTRMCEDGVRRFYIRYIGPLDQADGAPQ